MVFVAVERNWVTGTIGTAAMVATTGGVAEGVAPALEPADGVASVEDGDGAADPMPRDGLVAVHHAERCRRTGRSAEPEFATCDGRDQGDREEAEDDEEGTALHRRESDRR